MTNKTVFLRTLAAASIMMAVSAPALAGKAGEFTLGADVEYFWPDRKDMGLTKNDGARVHGGYRFTDEFGIRLSYARHDLGVSNAVFQMAGVPNNGTELELDSYRVEGQYFLDTTSATQPYITFGAQQLHKLEGYKLDDVIDPQLTLGAGVRHYFNKHFSLNAGANVSNDFSNLTDISVGLGVAMHFGGSDDAPVAAAPVAEAPAACTDADNDGVCDNVDQCPGTPAGVAVDATGCPATIKEEVSIEMKVLFDYDKSVVKAEYMGEIEKVAKFLKDNPSTDAIVEGHTDSRGSDAYNQALSERRANAVREALTNQFGIDANRIKSVGYGEARPVGDNNADAGRSQNRRVISVIATTVETQAK